MNKIITIQFGYLFGKYPSAVVNRDNGFRAYIDITKSSKNRIINTIKPGAFVKLTGNDYTGEFQVFYK